MPLILPCSASPLQQACFHRSDQPWTVSQIFQDKAEVCCIKKVCIDWGLCDVCRETSSRTNTLLVPLFQTSTFRFLFASTRKLNFHYFLAALFLSIKTALFMPARQTETCLQLSSQHPPSCPSSRSHQTHIHGDFVENSSCNMHMVHSAVFCHTVCSQSSNRLLHTKS